MGVGDISERLWRVGPAALTALSLLLAVLATGHVLLQKRDARAAFAWLTTIWLVPGLGIALYAVFGINRIRRRARSLRFKGATWREQGDTPPPLVTQPTQRRHLASLVRLCDALSQPPLVGGNAVTLYEDGDEAFPPMLEGIAAATRSVLLATYIFDDDRAGRRFLKALVKAQDRGACVRVLIDDIGARYSFPSMPRALEKAEISVARFLPTFVPWRLPYMNLRNHRKVLVVDGELAFTGGINVREGNLLALKPAHPIRDVHARVEGPVVAQLAQAFVEDWRFATGEPLEGPRFFPALEPRGHVTARTLLDGPDEDLEVLKGILLGALSIAQRRVQILTPYFIPDEALLTALGVCALRGVDVQIVLPEKSNLRLVQRASNALLEAVLARGCRVFLTPPPFDHSKLMVVDGAWTLLGSANWDARSLRLNFELNLESYDESLAARAAALIDQRTRSAQELSLSAWQRRALAPRLVDGLAHLLSPYL